MGSYTVVGEMAFRGHAPGETFEADLSEDEESRAVSRGSIVPAGASEAPQTADAVSDDDNYDTGAEPEEGTEL